MKGCVELARPSEGWEPLWKDMNANVAQLGAGKKGGWTGRSVGGLEGVRMGWKECGWAGVVWMSVSGCGWVWRI